VQVRQEIVSGVEVPIKARGLRQAKVCQAKTQQKEPRF
jgi:hypothetical protein